VQQFVRVTVGADDEIDRLLDATREIVKKK
jgi:histidinol-phosphate/aromatic aminotransferase/cobyric acid decarboxylase-like protein